MTEMNEHMTGMDWTTPEYLGNITAEELSAALDRADIGFVGCGYDEGQGVSIAFNGIEEAGAMVTLGVPVEEAPGSFYDRATASCLTLTAFAAEDVPEDDPRIGAALDTGWTWIVHPDRLNGRKGWHVSVEMSADDAQQLTANLNASRRAGTS